jgi:stearoyl-CoA desaturase (delta-9 desaturase)
MCRKHDEVKVKGKTLVMMDLESDAVVMFQKVYFLPLAIFFSFILPTILPWYFYHEDLFICWSITMLRYALSLNFTWLVNSAAHLWGHRPYDK